MCSWFNDAGYFGEVDGLTGSLNGRGSKEHVYVRTVFVQGVSEESFVVMSSVFSVLRVE